MPVQTATHNPSPAEWCAGVVAAARTKGRRADKASGRCLVDVLDDEGGLSTAECYLLWSVYRGTRCKASDHAWREEQDLKQLQSDRDVCVRASFLRFLALGGDELVPVHEAGLELSHAYVDKTINLSGGTCIKRFCLDTCYVNGALRIDDASLGVLVLQNSRVAGITGSRAKITGTAFLENVVSDGLVSFYRAEIAGSLQCAGASIGSSEQWALECTLASIGGDVHLDNGFKTSWVSFKGAHVGGSLNCSGATLANPGKTALDTSGWALNCRLARIGGDVSLNNGFNAGSCVSFNGAHVGGSLNCSGATLANPGKTALDAEGLHVDGSVVLTSELIKTERRRFTAMGEVLLRRAHIGGNLECDNGQLDNADKTALRAEDLHVDGSILLRNGFSANGEVRLLGANIGRDLDCSGGTFTNAKGKAIVLDRARISSRVFLGPAHEEPRTPFKSIGSVSLISAEIGELDCNGGSFTAMESEDADAGRAGKALDCTGATIKREARLSQVMNDEFCHRFAAQGEVSFQAAQIGGHLDCAGGRFGNPSGVALRCQAATVTGCVFLRRNYTNGVKAGPPFESIGQVSFTGTSVGLQLDCQGGRFENRQPNPTHEGLAGVALDLSVATIKDTLFLGVDEESKTAEHEAATVYGSLDLTGTTARQLVDNGFIGRSTLQRWFSEFARWLGFGRPDADGKGLATRVQRVDGKTVRAYLQLDGFVYERIAGSGSGKATLRRRWLRRQPPQHLAEDFRTQPFEQLVKVLRAMGHGHDADRIAIEKRRYLRKARPFWRRVVFSLWEVTLLDAFMGYGYHLARALLILTAIGIAYAYFYDYQARQGGIVPTRSAIASDEAFKACRPPLGNWVDCKGLDKAYRPFNPWLYSANVMLPIVEFGQKSSWEPAPDHPLVYYLQCAEIGIGWMCGILLGAVLGLVKRE